MGAEEGAAFSMSAEGTGTALFDLDKGFFTESTAKQHMKMSMTQPMAMNVEGDTTAEAKTSVKAE
jgi:hypothetical protein